MASYGVLSPSLCFSLDRHGRAQGGLGVRRDLGSEQGQGRLGVSLEFGGIWGRSRGDGGWESAWSSAGSGVLTREGKSEMLRSRPSYASGLPIGGVRGLRMEQRQRLCAAFKGEVEQRSRLLRTGIPERRRFSDFSKISGRICGDFQRSGRFSMDTSVKCSQDGNGSTTKRTLHDLYESQGQSPWYDNLCRPVTDLLPLIASGVRGVTSNPTIFQKAISSSNAYDEQFRQLIASGKDIESAYWELVIKDIQDACKLFESIYEQTDGGDGYVSVEVSPTLANDTDGTIEAAKWLHKLVSRPNVYIKIPATADCVPSIKEVISNGISVNVTLIFSLARYEAVIDAYLDGLEASGLSDLSRVTSVASFFVSRVDTLVDKLLEKIGTPEALNLRGKAAVAQATLAYKLYQKKFSGPRWDALVKKGAKKQRLLWASTSVKNPAYPDTLYVDPLIGPDTVSTMPDQALQAFIDHGTVSRTIDANISDAEGVYNALEKLGIDWNEVGAQLELEGVDSFKKSFESLLVSLQEKADTLKLVSH